MASKSGGVKRGQLSVDLISMLPDPILCHILSFLPMDEVVKTSLVSPRWQHLWKQTPCLHFFCQYTTPYSPSHDTVWWFNNFVYRVLLLHDLKSIENLCIELDVRDPHDVWSCLENLDSWVASAIARNVKNLKVHGYDFGQLRKWFSPRPNYPLSMFTSDSLETLHLSNIGTIHPPRLVRLPNLKTLGLLNVGFSCDQSVARLLSGCTSLLTLYVSRRARDNVITFSVQSPTLEDLTIISTRSPEECSGIGRLVIRTPALKYLCLDCTSATFLSLENLPLLHSAKITLEPYDRGESTSYANLIQAIHKVKDLHLNASAIQVIGHLAVSKRFFQVIQLTLEIDYESKLMWDVLECMPSLENLTLKGNENVDDHDGPFCLRKYRKVPECLITSLKMVSVENFARPDQLAMLGHILQNARLLQTMIVRTGSMDINDKFHFTRELPKFRRSFLMCRIEFSKDGYWKC